MVSPLPSFSFAFFTSFVSILCFSFHFARLLVMVIVRVNYAFISFSIYIIHHAYTFAMLSLHHVAFSDYCKCTSFFHMLHVFNYQQQLKLFHQCRILYVHHRHVQINLVASLNLPITLVFDASSRRGCNAPACNAFPMAA